MYQPIHLLQAGCYFLSSLEQKVRGPKRYTGTAKHICKQIVDDCWNGSYFNTSTHHYKEFWARDFGYCVKGLMKGHKREVHNTLSYALGAYRKAGRITTTISREGIVFSFPNIYSPDSVSLMLHSLVEARAHDLANFHRDFLQKEVQTYEQVVLDHGKVRRHRHFSGMRDYVKHDSSCYNHCHSILMARNAKKLGLDFQYTEKELTKNLNDYWTGHYYKDDRSHKEASGDANTLPYWIGKGKHFNKALKTIQSEGLDKPIPLAYSKKPHPKKIGAEIFVPGWQDNVGWPMLGLLFMQVVKKEKPKLFKEYKQKYKEIIEKYGTLYEVYSGREPYRSLFYHADEGMLWTANYE